MSDALYQKEIHLATRVRHSLQDTYMLNLSNRLQEIKKELDKHVTEITEDYRTRLIQEQQSILRKLNPSSERGMINPINTLANLQNPYII